MLKRVLCDSVAKWLQTIAQFWRHGEQCSNIGICIRNERDDQRRIIYLLGTAKR
jgi:hypothetical protein